MDDIAQQLVDEGLRPGTDEFRRRYEEELARRLKQTHR